MKRTLALIFLCCTFAVAAEAPKLSDAQNDKGMSLFKSFIIAQSQAQKAADDYTAWAKETIKQMKLPEGSGLKPDLQTDKITVVLPEEKKPEVKK